MDQSGTTRDHAPYRRQRVELHITACRALVMEGATQEDMLAFLDDPATHMAWGFRPSALEAVYIVAHVYGLGLHEAVNVVQDNPRWQERARLIET